MRQSILGTARRQTLSRQTLSESVWRRVQSDTWSSRSVRFRGLMESF
eukprot:COSAG02_NODE_5132_length_4604_cov_2.147170_1_plen_46_part_10